MGSRSLALILIVTPALVFACGGKFTGGASSDGGSESGSSSGGGSGSSSGSGSGSSSGSSSGGSSGSSSGGVSSSSSGVVPVDASVIDSPAPVVCTPGAFGGSSGGTTPDGGPPPCETTTTEMCSDGNTYTVDCQCPQATCSCTQTSVNGGGSGGSVSYPGCPSCTSSNLFALCAFPQ